MERKELIELFKTGIVYSNKKPYETVEYILNKKKTTDKKITFEAYDANLFGLPSFSTWNPDYKKEQKDFILKTIYKKLGDEEASKLKVQIDDVVIQKWNKNGGN